MIKILKSVCNIKYGVHVQPSEKGNIPYLMVRQFDALGSLESVKSDLVELDLKSQDHLLQDGDVLFVGKGNRLFAWCYRKYLGPYIASSIFFILRPNQDIIYPEYLATFLNTVQSKSALQQLGGGTNILSIRKPELEAFEIQVPSLEKQRTIAALAQLHQEEIAITRKILALKQDAFSGILSKLVK